MYVNTKDLGYANVFFVVVGEYWCIGYKLTTLNLNLIYQLYKQSVESLLSMI